MVSIRQGMPFSILVMVIGEIRAFLASSALLINKDSLISFKLFTLIDLDFRVEQLLHVIKISQHEIHSKTERLTNK